MAFHVHRALSKKLTDKCVRIPVVLLCVNVVLSFGRAFAHGKTVPTSGRSAQDHQIGRASGRGRGRLDDQTVCIKRAIAGQCALTTKPTLISTAFVRRILGNFPNTYAFTKSLAEGLVVEQMSEMPTIIIRPSIIVPVRYEPIPGWTGR